MAATNPKTSAFESVVIMRNKGQVTIPAELRNKMGWKDGERLRVTETAHGLVFEPVPDILNLFGILKDCARPEHWTMTAEEILESDQQALEAAMDEDILAELRNE